MTEPIDHTHAESISLLAAIRQHVQQLKDHAAVWQPGPCPDEWGRYQPPSIRHHRRY